MAHCRAVFCLLLVAMVQMAVSFQGLAPRAALSTASSTTSGRISMIRRNAFAMKVMGPKQKPRMTPERQRFENLEKDSERWFLMQEGREARGELNILENPAFYTTLFFVVPILILVWGFASGVIPGFVPVKPEYVDFVKPDYGTYTEYSGLLDNGDYATKSDL